MADQKISQLTALTTADQADLYAIVDVSANETKKITQDDVEDSIANSSNFVDELIANNYFTDELAVSTDFIDELVGNTYFTTTLANDSNFINDLTNNATFQSNVSNFISVAGGGAGGKPMTFAITDFESSTASVLSGYSDRETLVYSNGTTAIFQDILGYSQSRDVSVDWASATEVFSYVVIGSYIYFLLSSGAALRIYRYAANNLAAGGTLMTVSGATLTYGANVVMTSNGTKFFINYEAGQSADSFDIANFILSGTTLTYGTTVAAGSTALQFAGKFAVDVAENYYGTNGGVLYQYDNTGALSFTSGVTFANITDIFNWENTLYGSDNNSPLFTKLYMPDTDMAGGAGTISTYVTSPVAPGREISGGGVPFDTNTEMYIGLINLPQQMTINTISVMIDTYVAAGTVSFAIYSEDGQSLLLSATTATISGNGLSTTTVTPTTLPGGNYYFAVHSNGATEYGIRSVTTENIATLGTPTGKPVIGGTATIAASTTPATIDPVTDITFDQNGVILARFDS